ncbi:radical SAM protein [Desulfofustis limnaeus]|uniref:Radical SAM core domain-containing protein n=1 Tax=Desulfofustis limnaeus TaxID=2740163 RepID=A0ABN6M469_9BACT|nr:radical SAM protein [Desulfofustis limnaeus]BDD87671.1 hypothetical protein DPPLL_20360 [Desulfofustis limnaeus]
MSSRTAYITRKKLTGSGLWKNGGPQLARLDIELTERCNNNCTHCYINQPEHDRETQQREMTTDRVKQILAEAARLGCLTVRFTGGEPLLREDFSDIYRYTRRLGIKVILFTNATLITEEVIALFQRYPPGEPVSITIYGMNQASYEAVSRTKGSYAAAMNGVNLLLEHGIPVTLKTIHLPGRPDEITRFQEFLQRHPQLELSGGSTVKFNLRGRRDNHRKNEQIKNLRSSPGEVIALLTRDKPKYLKEKKQFIPRFMHPGGPELFSCGCGKGGSVDAYGFLQPCLLMRHPDLVYDLSTGTIEDALSHYFPRALERRAANPDYVSRCRQCFLKGLCDQCPAWSYMEHGTLDTPVDYLCAIAHEEALQLGLIASGEKAWEVTDWRERIEKFAHEDG